MVQHLEETLDEKQVENKFLDKLHNLNSNSVDILNILLDCEVHYKTDIGIDLNMSEYNFGPALWNLLKSELAVELGLDEKVGWGFDLRKSYIKASDGIIANPNLYRHTITQYCKTVAYEVGKLTDGEIITLWELRDGGEHYALEVSKNISLDESRVRRNLSSLERRGYVKRVTRDELESKRHYRAKVYKTTPKFTDEHEAETERRLDLILGLS